MCHLNSFQILNLQTIKIASYTIVLDIFDWPIVLSEKIIGISLINLFVYLSFIVISGVGYIFGKINLKSILLSSLIFFIVTNFGVWLIGYPNTLKGFLACYVAAIPFFGWTIVGDLFYSYSAKLSLKFFQKKYISVNTN